MDFEIDIGGQKVPARLPLMPRRFQIVAAYADALEGSSTTAGAWRLGLVLAAAIGAVWAGPALACRSLKECGWDVEDYGEGALDALMALYPWPAVQAAGFAAVNRLSESIPTHEEVEDAVRPFAVPAGDSIGTTS